MKMHDEYKAVLQARLQELGVRLEHIEDELDEKPDPDFEERATEREDDEVLEKLGQAGLHEIQQIKSALNRIKNGTFGTCAKCGEPIGEKRLNALPYAALCIKCAEASS